MAECWKDITGYPGYQVSDCGRVRTHDKVTWTDKHKDRHWKDRILKQKVSKDKCCRVSLWKDGKERTVLVHRLVASEFLGHDMETDLTVNHKDGNRLNNHLDNLEWMTRAENIRYGFENGQYPSIRIILMDENGEYICFNSIAATGRFLKRSDTYINKHSKKDGIVYDKDGKKFYII